MQTIESLSLAAKMHIWQLQITFYVKVFAQHRMKSDQMKVQALQDLPKPAYQKELQSF